MRYHMKYLTSAITTSALLISSFTLALPALLWAQSACTTTLSPGANLVIAVNNAAAGSTILPQQRYL